MKILHVISVSDPRDGGPIEGVTRLGEAFRAHGHEQELLTLDPPDSPWLAEAPMPIHALGVPLGQRRFSRGPLAHLSQRSPAAVDWLREHVSDYDGIIVDGLWNAGTRTARAVLPKAGVPYLVFSHGMLDPWFRKRYPAKHAMKSVLWQFNEGPLLRAATAVAFTCEQERKLARETWKPWGMREAVVGFGTSPPPARAPAMEAAFRSAVPDLGEHPYFLFMSRIHEKKGVDLLLQAFGETAAQGEIDLVVAGPGDPAYLASLKQLAQECCPQGRVHWPGMLSGPAKWGALYGCEAMTLISHQENFGVIVAEALGCARPVIITDQVNIFDEVEAADAGVICTDNATSAVDGFTRFHALAAKERQAMGQRGQKLFQDRFTMEGTAERVIALLANAQKS